MIYDDKILLGQILKVLGYDGTVAVRLEEGFVENIPEMESVFIETEGKPVPFFISGSDYQGGNMLRLRFEGYESVNKMTEFTGCNVYLTTTAINHTPAGENNDITGYKALHKNKKILGTVSGIIKKTGQWLIRVVSPGGQEILVPYHKDLIVKTDTENKTMIFDLPEGLADINL